MLGTTEDLLKIFLKIVKPLLDIHPNISYKNGKKVKSSKPFILGKDQQEAFDDLRQSLSSPPILGYADYNLPFEVRTDASLKGLVAMLYQKQEGKSDFLRQ